MTTPFYFIESLLRLRFDVFFDLLKHLAMPTLALGLPLAAVIARVLKGALNEAMAQDYVLLARLKGMSELRLVLQEALRNAIGPTLAGLTFDFAHSYVPVCIYDEIALVGVCLLFLRLGPYPYPAAKHGYSGAEAIAAAVTSQAR